MHCAGTVAVITRTRGPIDPALSVWVRELPSLASGYVEYFPIDDAHVDTEIAAKRNLAVARMRGDWLLQVDADCVPPPQALPLLTDAGPAVIGGVVLDRSGGFEVCALRTLEPTERYRLAALPPTGMIHVMALGTGCLLVRREVFAAMTPPYFRVGQLLPEYLAEDTDFCLRAAERGYPSFLHCGVRVAHRMRGLARASDHGDVSVQWEGASGAEVLSKPTAVLV